MRILKLIVLKVLCFESETGVLPVMSVQYCTWVGLFASLLYYLHYIVKSIG